jgi:hypothetical protein
MHHLEAEFAPTQFSISSKFHREKSNADGYPVGAGLVFLSNSLGEFHNLKKYYQIQTKEQYAEWYTKRKEINLPLGENEPAAFFSLGSEREVSVNFEEPRA